MTIKYERQYGVATTLNFVLFDPDGVDMAQGVTIAAADSTIMKDEGVDTGTTTNVFVDEGKGYSIALTATEMSAARIVVYIIDVTATKEWLDEVLIVETYGHESSQHARRDPAVMLATDIATVGSQTSITLTNGTNDNNTLLNSVAMIVDNSSPDATPDRSFRNVTAYTGSTKTVTLASAPDFTIAAGDLIWFFPTADVETAAEIASAVWEEARSGHVAAGTFGEGVLVEDLNSAAKASVNAEADTALTDANIVDGVLDEVYETGGAGTTVRQFLRLAAAALFGKLSGAATTTVLIRDESDVRTRITATVDESGNRSAITLDKS